MTIPRGHAVSTRCRKRCRLASKTRTLLEWTPSQTLHAPMAHRLGAEVEVASLACPGLLSPAWCEASDPCRCPDTLRADCRWARSSSHSRRFLRVSHCVSTQPRSPACPRWPTCALPLTWAILTSNVSCFWGVPFAKRLRTMLGGLGFSLFPLRSLKEPCRRR